MRFVRWVWLLPLLCDFAGCGRILDDLAPTGTDQRPPVQKGTVGSSVGQNAPAFALPTSLGKSLSLSAVLDTSKGVVLYFTMWCPICDVHMSSIRSDIAPAYPGVRFFLVDYVSGSVSGAREAQVSNGYDGPAFTVLADTVQAVLGAFAATMGTTVAISAEGIVLMNEDFKDGSRLEEILGGLP